MENEKKTSHNHTTEIDNELLLDKITELKQNTRFLQYKKGIIQDSLSFVLNHSRVRWSISDQSYMKLLNYYLTKRASINKQLYLNERIINVFRLQYLVSSLKQSQNNLIQFNDRCKLALDTLQSMSHIVL